MKSIFKKVFLPALLVLGACDLDKDLVDPNQVSVAGADVNLLLNAVELDFADFYNGANNLSAGLVRHSAMTGGYRYQTAYQPQTMDDVWYRAYALVLVNAKTLIPLAEEKNLTTHVAVAKILSAYTYITLVDLFGDVPQAEASRGDEGVAYFNPNISTGSEVYAYAIQLINEARTELAKTGTAAGAALTRDVYYSGNRANWTALANSLELKAWVNISTLAGRKAEADARITALLGSNLIDTEAENFTYKYSATTVPNSRHPWYNQYYGPNAGTAGGYIGTSFLYEIFKGKVDPADNTKTIQDPRWRYYVSRQAGSLAAINSVDPKALGCTPGADPAEYIAGNYPFCLVEPGFYGRDHGDASGTPPDGPVLTAAGIYPAAGRPDNASIADGNSFVSSTVRGQGGNGAGILPIYMAPFTDYIKAEILARNGDAPGAKTRLNTAITNSIASVKAFAASKNQVVTASLVPANGPYLTAVNALYDAASDKLKIIGREFWIASWGNALEAYNSYRRTGGPDILQPPLQTGAGPWMRSLPYSSNYVNLNSNAAPQKNSDVVNKVFWDGNPATLK